MSWTDQNPPAGEVLLSARVARGASDDVHFEIDRIDGKKPYRVTYGNLFGSHEWARTETLEDALRAAQKLHTARRQP